MPPVQHDSNDTVASGSALTRTVRKGMQVVALAAALVPLGSVPVTPTDQLIGSPRAASAQPSGGGPGTLREALFVDGSCGPEGGVTGTALAVVPGGKAGFPNTPTFLVTSCQQLSGDLPLFFTAADGGEGFREITTIFPTNASTASRPTTGWEALALRGDRGDLLACGRNGNSTVLWAIDFSPYNSTPDGTATFLRNGPNGSSCGAIAWDSNDSSVYQTPTTGLSVLHFQENGTALPAVPVPAGACTTSITGLGIAGTSLFVACAGTGAPTPQPPKIAQLFKSNGSLVRQFDYSCDNSIFFCPAPPLVVRGVPDDPTSFGGNPELLWTLVDNRLLAFEMAANTIGQRTGMPVLTPGACPGGVTTTSDGDALLDCWKDRTLWTDGLPGINYAGLYNGDPATRDVTLCVGATGTQAEKDANCAKQGRPDLFLEIDHMDFHRPEPAAITAVVGMFGAPRPQYPNGIALHVQVDDVVTVNGKNHFTNIAFPPCTAPASPTDTNTVDFNAVKRLFFGTAAERASLTTKPNALNAKALAFRYAFSGHSLFGMGTTSGCANIGGPNMVVTLGSWATKTFGSGRTATSHGVGSVDQQSGTFAHEFGHTLGLRHGGFDNINCKANYVSLMNYNHQFPSPTARALEYSGEFLAFLDKTFLVEANGVGPDYTGLVGFGPVPPLTGLKTAQAGAAIDWNKDGDNGTGGDIVNTDLTQTTSATGGCPANQRGSLEDTTGQFLSGFDDWANLKFNFRDSIDFGGGNTTSGETALTVGAEATPAGSTPDITFETATALTGDASLLVIDVKKNNLSPGSIENIDVAILSTAEVDATTIVPRTIRLQGFPPATWSVPARERVNGEPFCDVKDDNGDGRRDLVCKFRIPADTMSPSETMVYLIGVSLTEATPEGQPVGGTDTVSVHP